MPSSTLIYTLSLHDALPISEQILDKACHVDDALKTKTAKYDSGNLEATGDGNSNGDLTKNGEAFVNHDFVIDGSYEIRIRAFQDRKSTRLNSSHSSISYAVFYPDLHSFPTRRSSDLRADPRQGLPRRRRAEDQDRQVRLRQPRSHRRRQLQRRPDQERRSVRQPRLRHRRLLRDPHPRVPRSEEHTSELQSQFHLVCRLLP